MLNNRTRLSGAAGQDHQDKVTRTLFLAGIRFRGSLWGNNLRRILPFVVTMIVASATAAQTPATQADAAVPLSQWSGEGVFTRR